MAFIELRVAAKNWDKSDDINEVLNFCRVVKSTKNEE